MIVPADVLDAAIYYRLHGTDPELRAMALDIIILAIANGVGRVCK